MIRPLVIVGAGGFARETIEVVREVNRCHPRWELVGVLDDDPRRLGTTVCGVEVIGPTEWLTDHHDVAVTVCIGNPANYASRCAVVGRLGIDEDRYATLVHPGAVVPGSAVVGRGSVVHAGCVLTADVCVGRHVALMPHVVLTHDDVVEDFATFGAGVRVAGGVRVGTGAYLGSGCLIRENLSIGAWSLVGMGSVVVRSVPAGEIWLGHPAKLHGRGPHHDLVAARA